MPPTKQQLLAEVDDVLRTTPPRDDLGSDKQQLRAWIGRAAAAVERWDHTKGPTVWNAVHQTQSLYLEPLNEGFSTLLTLLWQARADLHLEVGPQSVVIPHGQVFTYFDEVRRVIEKARTEVFFVDPYLDADFMGRYMPHVSAGVTVRLLGHNKIEALLTAVEMCARQSGLAIAVRSSANLHDRFLFVDQKLCYLSGASFKDGALNAPTTLTQIADGFGAMWDTYEKMWQAATVKRP